MRTLAFALTIGLGGAVVGCAPPPLPSPPSDPRVVLTPDLGLLADPVVIAPGLVVRAQVRLVNPTKIDRPVVAITDWATASGMPVRTLLSAPRRFIVPRFGNAMVEVLAPSPQAVQFRIRVEPDYSN